VPAYQVGILGFVSYMLHCDPSGLMSLISPTVRNDLVKAYSASDRHYHDLRHIEAMLDLLRKHVALLVDPTTVEAAIWFHDAVYDTHRDDNEQRSADLAQERLSAIATKQQLDRIVSMIRASANHVVPSDLDGCVASDCALFLDMDLAILASAPHEFAAYEQAVRREYVWVTETMWIAGRRRVLETFMMRDNIYSSPQFRLSHETAARRNLAQALSALNANQTNPRSVGRNGGHGWR
jgi:predicted metal-dependent HD superfamily phosphohydrolase